MYNHIEKLIEATNGIEVSYQLAFDSSGSPDIGIRGAINGDINSNSIIIDDIVWLIAGDIINAATGTRITDIHEMKWHKPNSIYINLRAQSIIAGTIVQIHLGRKNVTKITKIAAVGIIKLSND